MPINSKEIKNKALELGLTKIGIIAVEALEKEKTLLQEWLALGYHGKMGYLARNFEKLADPKILLPSAKSIIAVALNYYTPHKHSNSLDKGKISRYAWGDDYHDVLGEKLKVFLDWIKEKEPTTEGKCFVDAGPMMDKVWAVKAGIGWLGKHTNVITRDHGSWIFLGEILLNLELEYDNNIVPDFCGTCTRCIDACPTNAIVAPYLLDATRCISYGTIELKDSNLPPLIADNLQNWIFGCDVCQDVCPWNRFSSETNEQSFQPREGLTQPDLGELEQITPLEFKERFKGSPITRPKHAGFLRNIKAVQDYNKSDKASDSGE
ncbi:MAG: tRNA epoxyqueuosine(34) reductase QueG [Acidobacteria bacterium]|nr:tRNA epoxyqueuosine(34) reductase QueG [Acidobacteriota bacterium]